MDDLTTIQKIAVLILPVLFAITAHEAAHGWVAKRLGDNTASMLGRVTLNPFKHIDPVGTVLVPLLMFLFSGFLFGWAKPVPVDWRNLNRPKRDMGIVALAGPIANLIMAIFWSLIAKGGLFLYEYYQWLALPLIYMGGAGVFFNIILMALNMLPIPPLDGGRVTVSLLPQKQAYFWSKLEPYGLFIIVGLLITGYLGYVLSPVISIFIAVLPASDIVAGVVRALFY